MFFFFVSFFFLQHVQLLTQVNMLCNPVGALQSEAQTTKLFLVRKLGIKQHISVLFFRNFKAQEKTEHALGALPG